MEIKSGSTVSNAPPSTLRGAASSAGAPLSLADRVAATAGDVLLLLGRVAIGGIFVQSGLGKLVNLSGFASSLASGGVPMPSVMATIGAMVEAFGGLAIVLGFQVRYAAALMILFTLAATMIAHRFWTFPQAARGMQQIQFFKNVAIIGGFLFLFVVGAGRFSLDGLRRRRR